MKRFDLRNAEEFFFKSLMLTTTVLVACCALFIVGVITQKGLSSLSFEMLTQTPKGGFYLGKEGGILNAIVGSLLLAGGATAIALSISIPIAIYLNVYTKKNSWLAHLTRTSLDVMCGIPSIVYGAFGFTLMLTLGLRTSLLAGMITVACLILPILCRGIDESLRMTPKEMIHASYSLGATRSETALKVVLRQGFPGLLSAVLMAFGRGIGDSASVLFTAGFSDAVPTSLSQPVATLPLAIFFQLGTPFPEVRSRAYASAFVLTVMILFISLLARLLVRKLHRHVIK